MFQTTTFNLFITLGVHTENYSSSAAMET